MSLPFKCDQCGKELAREWTLKRHQDIHIMTREKFQCDKCIRQFTRRDLLSRHYQERHQGIQVEGRRCHYCGQRFERKFYDETHEKTCQARRPSLLQPYKTQLPIALPLFKLKWQAIWLSSSSTVTYIPLGRRQFQFIHYTPRSEDRTSGLKTEETGSIQGEDKELTIVGAAAGQLFQQLANQDRMSIKAILNPRLY